MRNCVYTFLYSVCKYNIKPILINKKLQKAYNFIIQMILEINENYKWRMQTKGQKSKMNMVPVQKPRINRPLLKSQFYVC